MKKSFITTIIILFGLQAAAQFGIKAGANFATIHNTYYSEGSKTTTTYNALKMTAGFNLGVTYDFGDFFVIQPGLYFSQKGCLNESEIFEVPDNMELRSLLRINYIELPINFLLRPKLGDLTIFAGVGVSFSYALSGKVDLRLKTEDATIGEYTMLKFGNKEESELKAFDIGAQALVGFEYHNISLAVNYNLGLLNSCNIKNEKFKNRVLGLSLGYIFRTNN